MQYTVLADRIAVREDVPPEVVGSIFSGAQKDDALVKTMVHGEILALGPGKNLPTGRGSMWGLKVGDRIAYSPVKSEKRVIDGERITFIRLSSVAGVLE